jgi:hypothetical protein
MPRDLHDWYQFITPAELRDVLAASLARRRRPVPTSRTRPPPRHPLPRASVTRHQAAIAVMIVKG